MTVYAGLYSELLVINKVPTSGVAVTVYQSGTTTLATLYSDRLKSTTVANPVTSDASANLVFYADPGTYDLAGPGLTVPVVVGNDPAETFGSVVASALAADVAFTGEYLAIDDAATAYAAKVTLPAFVASGTTAAAVQAVIDAMPVGTTIDLRNNHKVGGGGEVWLQRNATYVLTGTQSINLPPNVVLCMNGATIDHQGTGSAIKRSGTSPYDCNGIGIRGPGTITSTTATAAHAIHLIRCVEGSITGPLLISGFADDGIALEQCQWLEFSGVQVLNCAGWGLWQGGSTDDGLNSNNQTFTRCKFENCGSGGVHTEDSFGTTFVGCTSQYHDGADVGAGGPGLHVYGGNAIATSWFGGHFEGNPVHVFVEAVTPSTSTGRPRGTVVNGAMWVISAVCLRFVKNHGIGTLIKGGASQNDGSSMPTTNTTNAPFETHSVSAPNITIEGFPTITGITNLICNETPVVRQWTGGGLVAENHLWMPNTGAVKFQTTAGTVYRNGISMNSSNNLLVGDVSAITRINGSQFGWNKTPVNTPSGMPAAATDLATAITLVNFLRSSELALGWMTA